MDTYDTDHNFEDIPSTYICGICNEIFNERNDFDDHIVSHGTKICAGNNASECSQAHVKRSSPEQTAEKEGQKSYHSKVCAAEQYLDESTYLEHVKNPEQKTVFSCSTCNELCSTRTSLKEYEQVYRGEKSYKCDECNQSFGFHFNFISHKRVAHDKSPFQCEVCNKACKTKETLEGHSSNKNKKLLDASNPDSENTFVSNLDNSNQVHKEPFVQGRIIKKEQQESLQCQTSEKIRSRVPFPNERCKFMCDICNKFCVSKNSLKEHKLVHSGERPHKCEKCLRTFRFYYNFLRHQLTHEKPSLECKICFKVYAIKDSLKKHFFAHHAHESPDGFNCSLCEKRLSGIDSLWQHYLNHVNRYSFKCKVCNKGFGTRSALKSHTRIHPDPLCKTAASSPSDVRCNSRSKHVATENPGSSELHEFKCNTCGRNFQNVILLRKHMPSHSELVKNRVLQSGKNIKNCQVVIGESLFQNSEDKQPSQKKEISVIGQYEKYVHDSDVVSEQNHKGKGKYICRTCNKRFKAQKCLVEHESIHSGEKPYKCEKCSKRFRFHNNFIRHTLIHGKPTYECEACNKVFFTKDALKKHSVSHSNLGIQSVSASTDEDRATSNSVLNNACNNIKELVATDNSTGSNQIHIELQTQERAEEKPQEISFQSKSNCDENINDKYNVNKAFFSTSDDQCFRDELQPDSDPCPLNEIQEGISKQKMTLETAVKIEDTDSVHQSKSILEFSRSSDNMEVKEKELLNVSGSSDVVFSLQHCKGKGKYFCNICNKRFQGKKRLEEHKTTHNEKKLYKCDKCSRNFGFYRNFFKHALTHGKPSFKCEVCQKIFITKDILKEHFNRKHSHKPKNSFKCALCGKVLLSKQSLQRHYLIHTGEKPFTCEICNKGFTRKYYLFIHQHTHVNDKYFDCSSCGKAFNSQYLLKRHCENELHCKKVKLSIKFCNKNFQNEAAPQIHALDHVKDTNISILCSDRDSVNDQSTTNKNIQSSKKIETSKSELIEESISTPDDQSIRDKSQSDSVSYPLNEILGKISMQKKTLDTAVKTVDTDSSYQSKSILEFPVQDQISTMKPVLAFAESIHAQEEISQSSDNLVCQEKELLSVSNSSHAMFSEQNCKGKGKHICATCKKRFKAKKSLEEHESVHSGEKPYKCDKCSRSFGFYGNFVRHSLMHGKPSFECEICNKKFQTKEYLKRHKLSKHSNNFKCEICEKKLSTKLNLQNHYLTHTVEKPFTCDICNEIFARKSLLTQHEQTHTDKQNMLQDKISTVKPGLVFAESNQKQEEKSQFLDNSVYKEKVSKSSYVIFSKQNCKGKGKYICATCKKRFNGKKALEEHESIHSGEKPYKCDKCSQSFGFYVSHKNGGRGINRLCLLSPLLPTATPLLLV
ncbi:Zinc finger protein 208 [Araneus ventricosus]|uniref:Zinc finger protein 208 n=1 Tax=Araneus ventricosus TaxID=182803 RepID=A0A4Y2G8A5_ARAVE|nr:Zinc finger protein 208 [Araneus ventricosus]